MARFATLATLLLLSGCAMPTTIQRVGVGFNTAVANLTDELTLTEIVTERPRHFTSISRLTGSITLKATAGFNEQIKESAPTDTNSTVTTNALTGQTIATTVMRAVASGGNQLNPSVGGEVDTNPSFDIDPEDTKEFTSGMLASVDSDVILDLLNEGYDQAQLMSLLISRIDFTEKRPASDPGDKPPVNVLSISTTSAAGHENELGVLWTCYAFSGEKAVATPLAPVSRIASADKGAKPHLSMQDLSLLDGSKLDLEGAIKADPNLDDKAMIVRPSSTRIGRLTWNGGILSGKCPQPHVDKSSGVTYYLPALPPAGVTFVGNGKVLVFPPYQRGAPPAHETYLNVDTSITVRNTSGIIRFVGDCLGAHDRREVMTCKVGNTLLFELKKGAGTAQDVSTSIGPDRYHIDHASVEGRTSLQTLAIIEELIDLSKSSTDKPVTTPVRVVS